jgi:hypothetical protein
MSYLTTIVHPLIIIRLLEHRLFTPLLKKSVKPRSAFSSIASNSPLPPANHPPATASSSAPVTVVHSSTTTSTNKQQECNPIKTDVISGNCFISLEKSPEKRPRIIYLKNELSLDNREEFIIFKRLESY